MLATGALPVRPQIPGIDLGNVFVVRQPRDALAIKDVLTQLKSNRAVIIGGRPHRPGTERSLGGQTTFQGMVGTAAQVMQNKLSGVAQALSPLEIPKLDQEGQDYVLLDVRTPAEFKTVRLDHPQVQSLPLAELREEANQLSRISSISPSAR